MYDWQLRSVYGAKAGKGPSLLRIVLASITARRKHDSTPPEVGIYLDLIAEP